MKSKRWVVGIFPDTNEFSAVPTNWITKKVIDGRTVIYCKWPPPSMKVNSDTIKKAIEPSFEWPVYNIRLADNSKEYCKYLSGLFIN